MKGQKKLPPPIMIIFGGSGDLTSRKLVPALFNLFIDGYLPADFAVVGVGRTSYGSEEKYREHLREGVKQFSRRNDNAEDWKKFSRKIFYLEMDAKEEASYSQIRQHINEKRNGWKETPM